MDFTNFQWLAQFGLGAVGAGFMFYFYRQDRQKSETIIKEFASDFKEIIRENTSAITELKTYLQTGTRK